MAAPNPGSIFIGVIGILVGMFAAKHWLKAKSSYGGWKSARAGVTKAKKASTAARGVFIVAARTAALAVVLVIVYVIATTTAIFKN